VLRNLKRTPSVLRAVRAIPVSAQDH
jgi:hypothetical protein